MIETEIPLSGGNSNSAVVRVGETVRRTMNSWSDTVHDLFAHLEKKGFDRCPRFLGVDDQGREILSFLTGENGFMSYLWESDDSVIAAAKLLRKYHDATADYVSKPNAAWQFVYPDPNKREVICHNDFAPYNMACVNGVPYAIFDFDMAGPGPRIRDVAYAAYWFAPLSPNIGPPGVVDKNLKEGSRKLQLFCDTYGVPADRALMNMIGEVLLFLGDWLEGQSAVGNEEAKKLVAEGHLTFWRGELELFQENRAKIEKNLERLTKI